MKGNRMYAVIFITEGISSKSNILSLNVFAYSPVLVYVCVYVFYKDGHLYFLQKNAFDLML